MARTMFELPNDLLINIFDKKAELEMAERPDLYMTNHHTVCYSCGNHAPETKCRFNGINYKFCDFCWDGPFVDDTEEFIEYVNSWQTGDFTRMEKMYHQVVAPIACEESWNDFWNISLNAEERTRSVEWVKMMYERWGEMIDRYSDIAPDTPPGNEFIIDWDDSDSDVDS